NEKHGRIEMYLISACEQIVRIDGRSFSFQEGETILTEHSHKYTLEQFGKIANRAGFVVDTVWTDPEELFSVQYCRRV
ncbi:MAG: L-histidine N(alpha)-methyltransferase, partial [Proteobacteria bacterium]|nr:L-histidine N(alpha)-methyltransferase [Pseudomonadota bacterium]